MSNSQHDPNKNKLNDATDPLSSTDEAWAKLQSRLVHETPHPNWQQWAEFKQKETNERIDQPIEIQRSAHFMNTSPSANQEQPNRSTDQPPVKRRRKMSSTRKKWTTGVAACVIVGAVIATPFGNNAMAALLDQFRVQTLTAVDDGQLSDMFDQYRSENELGEQENRFGTFTSTYGKVEGDFSPSKAAALLNYTLIKEFSKDDQELANIQSSETQTLDMNVDEVNKAIQSLGGTELLPQSLDNTLITIHFPESIHYHTIKDEKYASLTQSKVPTVTFDASVSTDEVFKAIANLPFLPQSLKEGLQTDKIINGALPLPVISNGTNERLTVAGVPVVITTQNYSNSPVSYSAMWIENGETFNFDGGDVYSTHESFIAELEKLIQS